MIMLTLRWEELLIWLPMRQVREEEKRFKIIIPVQIYAFLSSLVEVVMSCLN